MIDLAVVNYNTRDKLKRLLDTLHGDLKHCNPPWRLWVADNGSEDGSIEFLKNQTEYYIESINYNANIGYASASNELAKYGCGNVIGILNADVWLTTEDVMNIHNAFSDPEVAVLGPKQRDESGRVRHAGIIGTQQNPRHRGWAEHDPDDTLYRDKIECISVSGSAYFIRRNLWVEMLGCPVYRSFCINRFGQYPNGALLPTRHFFEEMFLSVHLRDHGYSVYYDGLAASIGHTWMASTNGMQPFLGDYMLESKEVYKAACSWHEIKCED